MLVPVTPPSNVKLKGLEIAPVIAAPFAVKFDKTVLKGADAQTTAAHGSVAIGVVKVAIGLQADKLIFAGQVIIGAPVGLTVSVVEPEAMQPTLFTVTE
jgi:hypothetical protein